MLPEAITSSQYMRIAAARRSGGSDEERIGTRPDAQNTPQERQSRDFQLKRFKDEVYQRLDGLNAHYTVISCAVDITEEGFRTLYDSEDYYAQILRLISRDFSTSYVPRRVCLHLQVGATLDEYHAHNWSAADAAEYEVYAKHSFYRRSAGAMPSQNTGGQTSAYNIYRAHLQMQFEKFDKPPAQAAPRPIEQTRSIYDEAGYYGDTSSDTPKSEFRG